jgi:hypothetical protein
MNVRIVRLEKPVFKPFNIIIEVTSEQEAKKLIDDIDMELDITVEWLDKIEKRIKDELVLQGILEIKNPKPKKMM